MAEKSYGVMFPTLLPKFGYFKPSTLNELLELKSKFGDDARILAGGTDLILDLRLRAKKVKALIDIKNVKELHELRYDEGKGLVIGATVTLNELLRNKVVKERYQILWKAISTMGDFMLRNRATLVGNLCNASPAADSAPPLLIYKAKLELTSIRGTRVVNLKDFFVGPKKNILKPDEVVTKVYVPEPPENHVGEYLKFVRTSEDLAIVGIAALVANPNNPKERIVRLAYASAAPTPLLIDEVEDLFKSDEDISKLIEKAIDIVLRKVSPITDVRGTKEYRIHLIKYGTKYLLSKLLRGD